MKKRWRRPVKILFVLAVYVAGFFIGTFIVCIIPILDKRSFLFEIAETAAESYVNNDWIKDNIHPNILFAAYGLDGKLLAQTAPPNAELNLDLQPLADKNLGKIKQGQKPFEQILQATPKGHRHRFDILTFLGVPITADGEIVGAVFLARRFVDLPSTIDAFFFLYTGIFGIIGLYYVLSLRKERELERLRRDYIANISHELKSPISSIRALTETLADGLAKDMHTQSQYYGIILSETSRLDHAVKSMLELSRVQSGKLDTSKERVPANELFEPVAEKFGVLCEEMGISFSVSDSISKLPAVNTNAALVTQLLEILLDNAVKFVGEDGEISLSFKVGDRKMTVCIKDNGIGIDKETLPHIFERFYKSNRSYNQNGNGLGLTIAQEIAASLDERLWVKSEVGKGSQFFFTLPVSGDLVNRKFIQRMFNSPTSREISQKTL